MTKRLTITLVALALFVLIAVLPASAMVASPFTGLFNGSVILNSTPVATVYIGEDQLNITRVIYGGLGDGTGGDARGPNMWPAPITKIGWWAPGSVSFPQNPTAVIDVGTRMNRFAVSPTDFGPYTGNWYCLTASNAANGLAFVVADPSQVISAWDIQANQGLGADMTGKSVVRGSFLTVKVDTNLAAFTSGGRGNIWYESGTWNNATGTLTHVPAVAGNGLYLSLPDTGGFYTWSNGTVPQVPQPAAGTAGSVLTLTNVSIRQAGNVYFAGLSNYNYTRTMFYNNSVVAATESFGAGSNLTTNAAGTILMTSAESQAIIGTSPSPVPTAARDGVVTVKLKDETNNVAARVFLDWRTPQGAGNNPGDTTPLTHRWVNTQPWYLGDFTGNNGLAARFYWDTGAIDPGLGTPAYPAGTYTVWTESTLSRMKDNYKLGTADYTGKTVSGAGTVTLVSDTVKIEANKESVVRSKPFSVTITGRPLTPYYVWVKGTSSMSGGWDNQPPMIALFQDKVYNDTPNFVNNYPLGAYAGENFVFPKVLMTPGTSANSDVAMDQTIYNRTRFYALINTSASGTRTVEFVTTNWTKAQTYTIRVEQNMGTLVAPDFKSDEVDVKVEKGAVTITAAGDQSYYLGEEVKFSGTNTETQTTYLFITGPNLNTAGSRLNDPIQDPRRSSTTLRLDGFGSAVQDTVAATFLQRAVAADNTWDWKWGTANWALDAGTYTIYAVSGPNWASNLANVAYGTVSIIIKKPFVSATASQSTVAQNDQLFITGTAEGKPQQGIAIWIMGKNYASRVTQSVNSDASFNYEVTRAITNGLDAGQYFVVVQHPMQNQVFDIDLCNAAGGVTTNGPFVCNFQQGTALTAPQIFTLLGQGSLQGTDAAEALAQGINSPNVDDTYTKLVFLVEVPSIRIDPIGDRHVGDKFTITATTNLQVDDETLFEVYSSSFKPTQKSQSGEFSGASGTVKVTKGDTGLNKLSFDVDASTFKPDEYIVVSKWVLNSGITGTALFNVLEGAAPTAVPTKVVTAAPTAAAPTTVATPVPTATPTKTPTQPGFGALVALIGLGAVAFFVVRRH